MRDARRRPCLAGSRDRSSEAPVTSRTTVAILLVDHGSRDPDTRAHLPAVAERVAAARPDWIVRHAHMEFGQPDVPMAIADCIEAGATEIHVHPFFLNEGMHVRETIPGLVDAARARHPDVDIALTEHLGLHDGIVDAVLARVDHSHDGRRR
jgi:sirohydrochlorin cobaltochelatase